MKTLKLFAGTCIIFGMLVNSAIAQNGEKVDLSYTWEANSLYMSCIGEALSGSFPVSAYWLNGKYFERADGVLYGETSGKEYTLRWNWMYRGHGSIHAWTMGFVAPLTVWLDGKLVGTFHQAFKGTYTNDKTAVERWVIRAECVCSGVDK